MPVVRQSNRTGLDSKERIRKRAIRRARRVAKKAQGGKSSGSSRSSEASESSPGEEINDLGLFDPETKLQRVAELFLGVLTSQALKGMRSNLLQSIGSDDRGGPPQAISMAYYRQQLQRKASGPVQRELITLCAALDVQGSTQRSGIERGRHHLPENQIHRSGSDRLPLVGGTEDRSLPAGDTSASGKRRTVGGAERSVRRQQGEVFVIPSRWQEGKRQKQGGSAAGVPQG